MAVCLFVFLFVCLFFCFFLFLQDPSVDSTVLPPGTYVKVSGNLRSFQVSSMS